VARVLLIEDDEQIADSLGKFLTGAGNQVEVVSEGATGLAAVQRLLPDVVVLDLGLPDIDGLDVLKMIRSVERVPVIVATARDSESVIVRALDLGADDYVVKPFSGEQLAARIRALLRRGGERAPDAVRIGELTVNRAAREATLAGTPLSLRRKEFDLLALLASRPGEVVSRDDIAREVWGDPFAASNSTIDVHVSALRRKLGETAADPRYLIAVRGVGVKLVEPK
jgi:two-component system response regulator PrrA